jgi:hypothetical protein
MAPKIQPIRLRASWEVMKAPSTGNVSAGSAALVDNEEWLRAHRIRPATANAQAAAQNHQAIHRQLRMVSCHLTAKSKDR